MDEKDLETINEVEIELRVTRDDPNLFVQVREDNPNTHVVYSPVTGYTAHTN